MRQTTRIQWISWLPLLPYAASILRPCGTEMAGESHDPRRLRTGLHLGGVDSIRYGGVVVGWLMLVDVGWCWLMLVDVGWCWLMLVDVGWCWLVGWLVGWLVVGATKGLPFEHARVLFENMMIFQKKKGGKLQKMDGWLSVGWFQIIIYHFWKRRMDVST